MNYHRVGVKDSGFVNHESIFWFHNPKMHKIYTFYELFFVITLK